jgi:hypothetical protein
MCSGELANPCSATAPATICYNGKFPHQIVKGRIDGHWYIFSYSDAK